MTRLFSLALVALVLSGCGGLFGSSSLTEADVAGRYTFRTVELEPTSGLDSYDILDEQMPEGVVLELNEGRASIIRVQNGVADEMLADGSYDIRGRDVRVRFAALGGFGDDAMMPNEITFEGGGGRLQADIFMEDVDLDAIDSDEYNGVTAADARYKIELRRMK